MAAPVITPEVPAIDAIRVAKDQTVYFTVIDVINGVALATVEIYVNGKVIYYGDTGLWEGGWINSGYVAIADGYRFFVTPERSSYFRDGTTTFKVIAEDTSSNRSERIWRFSSIRKFRLTLYRMLIESIRNADSKG
jgi:hypothetical protein